jgi:Extracellular link domain
MSQGIVINSILPIREGATDDTGNIDASGNSVVGNANVAASSATAVASMSTEDIIRQILSASNIIYIFGFLAIYVVIYLVLGLVRGTVPNDALMYRVLDIIILSLVFFYLFAMFYRKSLSEQDEMAKSIYQDFRANMEHSITIVSTGLFIVAFYLMLFLLSVPMDAGNKPISVSIVENAAWLYFVLAIIVTFLRNMFGISVFDLISFPDVLQVKKAITGNVTTGGNGVAVSANVAVPKSEVFNIKRNMFTYDDAQSVCKSFGARLATYDEVEQAYMNGAEWCNYGWSADQSIYFPTQKSTWEKLQTTNNKHGCGRPGVNGGYMANAKLRFGVNCFGVRPEATDGDLAELNRVDSQVAPKTAEDIVLDRKVEFWKSNRDKLLSVNSFNSKKWSRY